MNIVQVGTGSVPVHPGVTGGVEKYIHYLSAALQRLGHEVTVIDMPATSIPPPPYRRLEVPLRWRHDSNLVSHALRGLFFGRAAARQLEQLIEDHEADIVNFHGQFTGVVGIPVARRHGVPSVFTMHNPLWSDERACQSLPQRAKFFLEKRAEAEAESVVGLSGHVTDHRVRFFGVSRAKVTVAPVGVDDYWFQPVAVTSRVEEKYTPNGDPLVLVVGRLAPYKNQLLVANALPHLLAAVPNARLVFAGPPDSSSYLHDVQAAVAKARAETRVIFAGAVPLAELAQLYSLARVFVLPSLQENCPQVLLEAMAQAKAIVASDIAPVREILSDSTALMVPPSDHEALASAVVRLLKDQGLREELGSAARQRAYDVYRWDVVAQQVAQMYERLLPTRSAGSILHEPRVGA